MENVVPEEFFSNILWGHSGKISYFDFRQDFHGFDKEFTPWVTPFVVRLKPPIDCVSTWTVLMWWESQNLRPPLYSTFKTETLCSRFCADISITANHLGIQLHSTGRTILFLQPINKLTAQCENYEQNSQLSEHALPETISQWCGEVCWHVNWCLWPPKLGGHRILLDNMDFDTVLILTGTLYSACIWLFLSDFTERSSRIKNPCCYVHRSWPRITWCCLSKQSYPEPCITWKVFRGHYYN